MLIDTSIIDSTCSLSLQPVEAGKTMEIMPHIGWSNAVPAARAQVNLNVNGANVEFNGIGYHDSVGYPSI